MVILILPNQSVLRLHIELKLEIYIVNFSNLVFKNFYIVYLK